MAGRRPLSGIRGGTASDFWKEGKHCGEFRGCKRAAQDLLDQLEEGPWPSFVKEIKSAAKSDEMSADLLGQLELSYEEKQGHWKHGGMSPHPRL